MKKLKFCYSFYYLVSYFLNGDQIKVIKLWNPRAFNMVILGLFAEML